VIQQVVQVLVECAIVWALLMMLAFGLWAISVLVRVAWYYTFGGKS